MKSRLPGADWTKRADLARLADVLGPEDVRWVGGAVRDTLFGMAVKDIDAATRLRPETVTERLIAASIRVVPTGIEHGTVTAILPDGPVEVTTLRRDVATDGRRATVEFADDWRDDAARRDFTINALYAHPDTLELSDYFGGLSDLAARRVRFIGDPAARIGEDHLRILRYFRFQARFGSIPDAAAEAACESLADTLKGLSRERVAMELMGLLSLPDPVATIERMAALGVLRVVLPENESVGLAPLAALVPHERAQNASAEPLRRLAALLSPAPIVAESLAKRLRLSRAQRERLACIAARKGEDREAPRALAYRVGMDCAVDRLLLAGASLDPVRDWAVPRFPLKGGVIVSRGIAAGPQVARILQAVEAQWVEEGFPNQTRAEDLLEAAIAAHKAASEQ